MSNKVQVCAQWLRTPFRGRAGLARLALLLIAGAVAAGMTVGNGVASRQARSDYDLAWLGDGTSGQVVQVDPIVGRANVRLQVADPGSTLTIQQGNGRLVVVDRKTGKITSIDLGTLLVGGSRVEQPGNAVKVLLAGSRLYIADLPRGTVRAVDPATQADIGTPWSAGRPLVDVGVDGAHDVWALDSGQHLASLRWGGSTLRPVSIRTVEGAGVGSVIIGHDHGITLVGSRGAIVRVGTGRDARLDAPRIAGQLRGPQRSPDGLVPVSNPGTSSVVIVGPRDAVVDDVSGYGCRRPGEPTAFDGKVYVPCSGAHRVLVLDVNGKQIGSAIPTPGRGDPQLTIGGGRLVIDVPGTGKATIVDPSGKTRDFPTIAPGIGVQNPNSPPPDPPKPPKPTPPKRADHGRGNDHGSSRGGDRGTDSGTRGGPRGTTRNPTGAGNGTPTYAASAQARPDGTVLVGWTAPPGAGPTSVTATSTGGEVARVPAGATSATVTVLDPGTTTAFRVANAKLDAMTNSVTTAVVPGAAGAVAVSSQGVSNGIATLTVSWRAAAGNGAKVSYAVSAGGGASKTTSGLSTTVAVPCSAGCTGTVTVTARNSAGSGPAASGTFTVSAPSAPVNNPPTQPQQPPAQNPPAQQPTQQAPPQQAPPAPMAMPSDGATLLSATSTAGDDSQGTPAQVHLTLTAPSDWAAFGAAGGTCTLIVDSDSDKRPIACGGDQQTVEFYASGTHEFWVQGTDGSTGRSVSSAHLTRSVIYRPGSPCLNSVSERQLGVVGAPVTRRVDCDEPVRPCPNCQIP